MKYVLALFESDSFPSLNTSFPKIDVISKNIYKKS